MAAWTVGSLRLGDSTCPYDCSRAVRLRRETILGQLQLRGRLKERVTGAEQELVEKSLQAGQQRGPPALDVRAFAALNIESLLPLL